MLKPQKKNCPLHISPRGRICIANHKNGFTLIELLVVVLIIGILASIALPQYRKVVEKSKASQAFSIIRTIAAAQENYRIANGTYARHFDELAVDIPWAGNTKFVDGSSSSSAQARSNADWSVQLYHEGFGDGIMVGRISGPYAGAGFLYLISSENYNSFTHKLLCVEHNANTSAFPFTRNRGDYCQRVWKASSTNLGGTYRMP